MSQEKLGKKSIIRLFWLWSGALALNLLKCLYACHLAPLGILFVVSDMLQFGIGLALATLVAILLIYPGYWSDVEKVLKKVLKRLKILRISRSKGGR